MSTGSLAYLVVAWIISAASLMITSFIVPGFKLKSFGSAMIAAAVVGLVNYLLKPLLLFLTLPFNILTLGLFTFVVDAIILKLSAALLREFDIDGWLSAILAAFLNAVLHGLLSNLMF